MDGCVGGAIGMTLYGVGIVSALGAVVELGSGEVGQAIVFGVVAYLCWLGIKRISGADAR